MSIVKYNKALRCQYNLHDKIDSTTFDNIDEDNGSLIERTYGDSDDVEDLIFDDDDSLTQEDVARTFGAEECDYYSRSRSSLGHIQGVLLQVPQFPCVNFLMRKKRNTLRNTSLMMKFLLMMIWILMMNVDNTSVNLTFFTNYDSSFFANVKYLVFISLNFSTVWFLNVVYIY